jgi:transposase
LKLKNFALSDEARKELQQLLNTSEKPYLRERAAAILQLADGRSFRWVALHGCLKERDPETVAAWYRAYCAGGIEGLHQLKRRFDPLTAEQKEQLLETIHQSPEAFDIPRSRWRLKDLKHALPFLGGYTLSGIWRLLKRHRIRLKRGQGYVTSPDPDYKKKWTA